MKDAEGNSPQGPIDVINGQTTVTELVEGDSPGGTTVVVDTEPPTVTDVNEPAYPADDGPLTSEQIEQIKELAVFEPKDNTPTYVQNEEQKDSNLWSNTVNSISQEDYQKASLAKLENHIDEIVELIKTGYLKFEDVPKYIQREVKDKL